MRENRAKIQQYHEIRRTVPFTSVDFGYQTLTLFSAGELEDEQIGYRISPSGEDLTGSRAGDWRSEWLVIGRDGLLGDPIFVDLTDEALPVFTAVHGEGSWSPELIATSLGGFIEALKEIESVSHGRSNPVELERNPLPAAEKEEVLQRIAEASGNASQEYWESWFAL